jgi:trehalose-6-phosphate synthase
MNLVAKEFAASQNPDDPGVLILSRFAGAAKECEGALLVNPYDTGSVAEAIARALEMPIDERRERNQSSFKNLSQNDIALWGERFLMALTGADGDLSLFPDGLYLEPATGPKEKAAASPVRELSKARSASGRVAR